MTEAENKPTLDKLVNLRPTRHFTRQDHERKWLVIDAKGQALGRLCSRVASLLRGKHKPSFTAHDDVGDFVVVINAKQVELRGNDKVQKKLYRYKHQGYRGNVKTRTAAEVLTRSPEKIIELAVAGMIPRGALGNRMMKKLKVYAGSEHPHKAQKPETVQP